jgi:hypothetical protein
MSTKSFRGHVSIKGPKDISIGRINPFITFGIFSAIAIIVFISLILGLRFWVNGPEIQGVKGNTVVGPTGPPGPVNISGTNDTFVGKNLNLTGNLTLDEGGVISFSNLANISYDNRSGCIEIEPKLCISNLQSSNQSIITINSSVVFNGTITTPRIDFGSNTTATIYYDPVTDTLVIIGASLEVGTLIPPIFIGNAGYVTNISALNLFLNSYGIFTLNATVFEINAFVQLLYPIISQANFLDNIFISLGKSIQFGDYNVTNGSLPFIGTQVGSPSNLTIDGNGFNLVLKDNVIIDGNLSISGNVLTDIKTDGAIIFNSNGAKIYVSGSCLVIETPSLCFNISTKITFFSEVTFQNTIQGNLTINGTVTILKDLNLIGTFFMTNLTITNTFNATNSYLTNALVQFLIVPQSGTAFINGALVSSSTSTATFNNVVNFLGSNLSSITCSQPFFDFANSGCTSICTNHSSCIDTFSSLTILNNQRVLGDIVRNNSLTPHPCCTSTGNMNNLYQQWSSNNDTAHNFTTGSTPGFVNLSFTINEAPFLAIGQQYIGFTGGQTWNVLSNATYSVVVGVDVDIGTTATINTIIYCDGSTVVISPNFQVITPLTLTGYTSQPRVSFQHTFAVRVGLGSVCQFQLAYRSGNYLASLGNRQYLSIKLIEFM